MVSQYETTGRSPGAALGHHDDVLPRQLHDTMHRGIRLAQLSQPLHLPGQGGWVLGLHSDPEARAYTELRHLQVRERGLPQELVCLPGP